jgi:magnesium chelatase family protein
MFAGNPKGESSAAIRKRVCAARNIQRERFAGTSVKSNAEMSSKNAHKFAMMSDSVERFAIAAAEKMALSARGYYRLLKVARTIADLRKSEKVNIDDISEALRYRAYR